MAAAATLTGTCTLHMRHQNKKEANVTSAADRREFIKISQAVGMGFLIMGAIGYFIKLSKSNFLLNPIYTAPALALGT